MGKRLVEEIRALPGETRVRDMNVDYIPSVVLAFPLP